MTRVYLIRHGETEWNSLRRYQGHSDIQLNSKGLEQAKLLSKCLASMSIQAVYSSDLSRAAETARIVAGPHGLQVQVDPMFRELHFGHWEGKTFEEINAGYPSEIILWQQNPGSLLVPGGESFPILQKRAYDRLLQLIDDHPEQDFALVAHGGTIRSLLCAILGVDLNRAWQFRQDNTALNTIDFYDGKGIIMGINDTHHLSQTVFPAAT